MTSYKRWFIHICISAHMIIVDTTSLENSENKNRDSSYIHTKNNKRYKKAQQTRKLLIV